MKSIKKLPDRTESSQLEDELPGKRIAEDQRRKPTDQSSDQITGRDQAGPIEDQAVKIKDKDYNVTTVEETTLKRNAKCHAKYVDQNITLGTDVPRNGHKALDTTTDAMAIKERSNMKITVQD